MGGAAQRGCVTSLKSLKERADNHTGYAAATVLRSEALEGNVQVPSNNVQRHRETLMMSKAELARKAGLSTLTIDRVEAGRPCRLDTKRKVLLALGLKVTDKDRVFGAPGALQSGISAGVETVVEQVRQY